jgi:hypothetical protein
MNFDGGFGCRPGSESHSGQIYCCVGMLAIVGQLHHINADLLGWWLCERQLPSGGLNGMYQFYHNHIGGVMVSVLALSVVDRGFETL